MQDELTARTVRITGYGGDEIEAYEALPLDAGEHGSVVVIHHMPGYDAATKEMVRKFAAHGYAAVCPNLYWREAPGAAPDDAAAVARAAGGVPDDRLVGDVGGAAAYLRGRPGSNGRVGVIGYCSGGRQSFLSACRLPLDAAVDCYGAFVAKEPPPERPVRMTPPIIEATNLHCPVLGLFGADDHFPAPDETAVLEAELTKLGKEYEFHTYPDAGHAFFAVDRPSYRVAAANEGWARIWEFYGKHLSGV